MPKITEINNLDYDLDRESPYTGYEGYQIVLDDGNHLCLLISAGQSCCENYGYASTEDDLTQFIGADLMHYEIVDQDLAVKTNKLLGQEIYDSDRFPCDAGGVIFLNVQTSEGPFQFTVYNEHNGYYGHSAKVIYGDETLLEDVL